MNFAPEFLILPRFFEYRQTPGNNVNYPWLHARMVNKTFFFLYTDRFFFEEIGEKKNFFFLIFHISPERSASILDAWKRLPECPLVVGYRPLRPLASTKWSEVDPNSHFLGRT